MCVRVSSPLLIRQPSVRHKMFNLFVQLAFFLIVIMHFDHSVESQNIENKLLNNGTLKRALMSVTTNQTTSCQALNDTSQLVEVLLN